MAKDYFQDILPPQNNGKKGQARTVSLRRDPDVRPAAVEEEEIKIPELDSDEDEVDVPAEEEFVAEEAAPARSIRNIAPSPRRIRDDMHDAPRYSPPMPRTKGGSRKWLWAIAIFLLAVIGVLFLIALRGTSVTVEPRTHTVVFDETSRFTAYPQQNTPGGGALSYTTQTVELEDSESVPSNGTVHAEEKASGSIVVTNDYTAAPVKLVKNTRFQTADGLIFRALADVIVPGKSGTTPGQVTVTVVADAVGEQYNIPPSKLTIPGLKGSAEFDKVTGQSAAAFTGGFNGDRPGVSDADLASGKTAVRGRLEQKIREAIAALSTEESVTFPEIAQITYTDLPKTTETGGARIHEKATALVPLLPAKDFALTVAKTVSAETDNAMIKMVGIKDFGGLLVSASTTPGVDPIQFQLTGQAMLIWQVNATELAQALAGRDQSAFQTIVTGFPGIESATARIEPFWSNAFPGDASRIRVSIKDPAGSK